MNWETVIGLEVHLQLKTRTKAYCNCQAVFAAEPNTHACPVCLGLPGALPVFNRQVAAWAVRLGVATNCHISQKTWFARKNYFYPDLAKGYQISQAENPICQDGHLELDDGTRIGIERIHMEEDTARSIHEEAYVKPGWTYLDYNRAGIPLLEVVSKPHLRSGAQAANYLERLRQILLYLEISEADMARGSLRCDVNISLRPTGVEELGTKVEIKNMNSIKAVKRAIELEEERQAAILEAGGEIFQETMTYNQASDQLTVMRRKEGSSDYRYFPEPDLPAVIISDTLLAEETAHIGELPAARRRRYIDDLGLSTDDAETLTASAGVANYFEAAATGVEPKLAANFVLTEVLAYFNRTLEKPGEAAITPAMVNEILVPLQAGEISFKMAKDIFGRICEKPQSPAELMQREGLKQVSDEGYIRTLAQEIIAANPGQTEQYRNGKTGLLGFFVGQLMKKSQGKANPAAADRILKELLNQ